jgi:outer membrane protein assembly factor BamB
MGGLLSTKAGLVFGGDEGTFFALNSRTGALLWSVETGGGLAAAPISYMSGHEQFVTVAAGRTLLTFSLPASRPANPHAEMPFAAR